MIIWSVFVNPVTIMLYSIDYSPGTKSLHNEMETDSNHVLSMHNIKINICIRRYLHKETLISINLRDIITN